MTLLLDLDGNEIQPEETSTFLDALSFAGELNKQKQQKDVRLSRFDDRFAVSVGSGYDWTLLAVFPSLSTTKASPSSE